MQQPHLFDLIREELLRLLNGYIQIEEVTGSLDRFIIPPRLGSRAGVLGALVLAERVCTSQGENA